MRMFLPLLGGWFVVTWPFRNHVRPGCVRNDPRYSERRHDCHTASGGSQNQFSLNAHGQFAHIWNKAFFLLRFGILFECGWSAYLNGYCWFSDYLFGMKLMYKSTLLPRLILFQRPTVYLFSNLRWHLQL